MKFRSKPREIEAEQFFAHTPLPFRDRSAVAYDGEGFYVVTAHNQKVYLENGDWVVPEPDGIHFYPIKDEIIWKNYEAVTKDDENY